METLHELEFVVGLEEVDSPDRMRLLSQVQSQWGPWSLVPTSSPSQASRRRLAVAARRAEGGTSRLSRDVA